MNGDLLNDLMKSVKDTNSFQSLDEYFEVCDSFLGLLESKPTKITSPSHHNYIFYQYDEAFKHTITRPINSNLFIENRTEFEANVPILMDFLQDLEREEGSIVNKTKWKSFISSNTINNMVYTIQQSIGCITDAFEIPNQARKRQGDLFENFVIKLIKEVGIKCEPRNIKIPIPNYPHYKMSYQLDLVFSRNSAIITAETPFIQQNEIVGSVKTTSKDRIDKIFLDKFLLSKLIGRDIPVIAIFLHDVQRASTKKISVDKRKMFSINSTFKTGHFMGYTLALNKLDGVYYVDPRPDMLADEKLKDQISNFQRFLVADLWTLSR